MKLATGLALLSFAAAALPASAASGPRPAKAAPRPQPTVAAVLARSGVDAGPLLSDLLGAGSTVTRDSGFARYAEERAALRACHAERYATARDNVLSGRDAPLRAC